MQQNPSRLETFDPSVNRDIDSNVNPFLGFINVHKGEKVLDIQENILSEVHLREIDKSVYVEDSVSSKSLLMFLIQMILLWMGM